LVKCPLWPPFFGFGALVKSSPPPESWRNGCGLFNVGFAVPHLIGLTPWYVLPIAFSMGGWLTKCDRARRIFLLLFLLDEIDPVSTLVFSSP
jgi:hypothetical protein